MIVIGIDEYQHWDNLDNAVFDARRLRDLLAQKYGFKEYEPIILNVDATREKVSEVIGSIYDLMEGDNLIIFFAGHGNMAYGKVGYWVPTEGAKQGNSTHYSNADLLSHVKESPAKHVLIISDSCFSGTLINQSRGGDLELDYDKLEANSSRWVFVSGGLEKVKDGDKGLGSPFGRNLIKYLQDNQRPVIAASQLFDAVITMTKRMVTQKVQASEIQCEKNHGGQMILRLSASASNALIKEVERILVAPIIEKFVLPPHYIARTVSSYEERAGGHNQIIKPEIRTSYLKDLVKDTRKIVLLGSAGSGKSVELQNLGIQLAQDDTSFIPIYKRLNHYVDEAIEKLLPQDWQKIDEDRIVLILDGLDEIQQPYFLTAVRRLQSFSEDHPLVRIVISCRTNFYEFPTDELTGTLADYSVQILNDIPLAEVRKMASEEYKVDGDAFLRDVHKSGYLDIISKPFFLSPLMTAYKKSGTLSSGRLEMMNNALDEAYVKSKRHFETSVRYPSREHAYKLLEKVAFVMETMGKNFITEDELSQITSREEFDLVKYMPLFVKDEDSGSWMFAHNNIQEFLASRVLQRQPFQKLIDLISISSAAGSKIKPTWTNTLSFYVSTAESGNKDALIDWVLANDPEVLVRLEPDRIPQEMRIDVFKQVFAYYNDKNIWVSSNNFSDEDLARFGGFGEIIGYLIDLIETPENSLVVALNAVHVLRHFDLNKFAAYRTRVRETLLSLFESGKLNEYGNHTLLRALADLGITDKDVIEKVLQRIGKSGNQYNRSGLYTLIAASPHINEYAAVFFDGLDPERSKELNNDRNEVNLMDENLNLDRGIQKLTSPKAMKELFTIIAGSRNKRLFSNYDLEDILHNIVTNAINAYGEDLDVFNFALDFHVAMSSAYYRTKKTGTDRFFTETHTEQEAVAAILKMEDLPRYRKEEAIAPLINATIVDHIVSQYQAGSFEASDIQTIFMVLWWRSELPEAATMMKKVAKAGRDKDNLDLDTTASVNWQEINVARAQRSFDLVFDKEAFLAEVEKVFTEVGKTSFTRDEFYDLKNMDGTEIDDFVPRSVIDLFRRLIYDYGEVTYAGISGWVADTTHFRHFQASIAYQHLNDVSLPVVVTKEQEEIIKGWCHASEGMDISALWFFVNRFSINIGEDRLLDFTLYFDSSNESDLDLPGTIEQLEKFIDEGKLSERVLLNLSRRDIHFIFWLSNAGYAFRKNLTAAYEPIISYLKSPHDEEYKLTEVLEVWFEKTGDTEGLKSVILSAVGHSVKWKAIALLKQSGADDAFLKTFFHKAIGNEYSLSEDKVSAANYLMEYQDLAGFNFLADHILQTPQPQAEYAHTLRNFAKLTNVDALDKLLELYKLGLSPEFKANLFNRLDNATLEGIFSIGTHSSENFTRVEAALLDFMERYKSVYSDLNFLHYNINRMRDQVNLKISKNYGITEALALYDRANTNG